VRQNGFYLFFQDVWERSSKHKSKNIFKIIFLLQKHYFKTIFKPTKSVILSEF